MDVVPPDPGYGAEWNHGLEYDESMTGDEAMMSRKGTQVTLTVPEGAFPGSLLAVPVRGGTEQIKVRVPEGIGAGSTLILTQADGCEDWELSIGDVVPAASEELVEHPNPDASREYRELEAYEGQQYDGTGDPAYGLDGIVAYTVRLETTVGVIDIIVRPDWAPHGTRRFLELAMVGDLNNISFYRAIKGCIVQFGLPVKRQWSAIPDDPPIAVPFLLGAVSFAAVGESSRKSTLFICIGDMSHCLGHHPWEAPIGAVAESSLDTLDLIETCYGDIAEFHGSGPDTNRISCEGDEYLRREFPHLTYITSAQPLDWVPEEDILVPPPFPELPYKVAVPSTMEQLYGEEFPNNNINHQNMGYVNSIVADDARGQQAAELAAKQALMQQAAEQAARETEQAVNATYVVEARQASERAGQAAAAAKAAAQAAHQRQAELAAFMQSSALIQAPHSEEEEETIDVPVQIVPAGCRPSAMPPVPPQLGPPQPHTPLNTAPRRDSFATMSLEVAHSTPLPVRGQQGFAGPISNASPVRSQRGALVTTQASAPPARQVQNLVAPRLPPRTMGQQNQAVVLPSMAPMVPQNLNMWGHAQPVPPSILPPQAADTRVHIQHRPPVQFPNVSTPPMQGQQQGSSCFQQSPLLSIGRPVIAPNLQPMSPVPQTAVALPGTCVSPLSEHR